MLIILRQFFFFLTAFVLRWPVWFLIYLMGRVGLVKFVFLVYPTDDVECNNFVPNIPIMRRFLSGRPSPGGLVVDGFRPIGIYFVVPDQPMTLMRKKNKDIAERIIKRMLWIKKLTGAKTIGLAGQLAPIFEKRHNIKIEPPFFSSTNGNIYSIESAINWAATNRNVFSKQSRIAIAGGGELGETLRKHLNKKGFRTDTVDVRFTRKGSALPINSEKSVNILKASDFVINLLPKGEDFFSGNINETIGKATSVIDFSRPAIKTDKLHQKVFMGNRVQKSGIRFVLALPGGWKQKQIPACSLPAMMSALTGRAESVLGEFCQSARLENFTTALVVNEKHLPEYHSAELFPVAKS